MPLGAEMFTINLYVALASPLVGSAAAAAAARLAAGTAWGLSPSACPSCGRRLGIMELIPVASWIIQRGKCRGCQKAIPTAYPLTELAAMGIALWAWLVVPPTMFIATCVFGWLLLVLSAIDIRTFRLPDVLTATLAVAGLVATALIDQTKVLEHVIGASIGYLAFVIIEIGYKALRKRDGLGRGDAKLLGAIGTWIGPYGLPGCIFVAAVSGIVFVLWAMGLRKRAVRADTAIPFGPFLAVGGWVIWVNGPLTF